MIFKCPACVVISDVFRQGTTFMAIRPGRCIHGLEHRYDVSSVRVPGVRSMLRKEVLQCECRQADGFR